MAHAIINGVTAEKRIPIAVEFLGPNLEINLTENRWEIIWNAGLIAVIIVAIDVERPSTSVKYIKIVDNPPVIPNCLKKLPAYIDHNPFFFRT